MTNCEHSAQAPALGKARKIPLAHSDRSAAPSGRAGPAPMPQGGGHAGPPRVPLAPPGLPASWDAREPAPMDRRFVLAYRDGQSTRGYYPPAEAEPRTAGPYDLDINMLTRTVTIRKSDGTLRVLQGTIPGIGTAPLQQLFKMLRYYDAVLPPVRWMAIEPEYDPDGWGLCLAPIIARLRKLFFGEKGSQHFIVTINPLAYGWNRARSFRIIALHERWWEL